ncbi:glucose-1-phosphate adenylyltransferase, partial [Beggiatoa alba]|nr:glucose-1-phosphate adenylyltransferase [Beggiatoa alba]
GTADSVFQNIDIIRNHEAEYVLILAGDHVYKMDYGEMLAQHVAKEADFTVACIEVPLSKAHQLGVMTVDNNNRIKHFTEKPSNPVAMPGRGDSALCSMGIYIFNKDFLIEHLIKDAEIETSSHDFGKDVIPSLIENHQAFAYPFRDLNTHHRGYWRDVGTVDAFWHANMELIGVIPELNLYDDNWPIWTYQEQVPPAKFVFNDTNRRGEAIDSMVSGGCIVSGATVKNSLLFSRVTVESYSKIDKSVILPNVSIGEDCVLQHAIIDKDCVIPSGMKIGVNKEEDKKQFYVTDDGITLVVPEMLGQHIHHVR